MAVNQILTKIYKLNLFFLGVILLFTLTPWPVLGFGEYGGENQADNDGLIRVGISSSDFGVSEHKKRSISATGPFMIIDTSTEKILKTARAGEIFTISIQNGRFNILSKDQSIFSNLEGPVVFKTTGGQSFLKIMDITRKGKIPTYRGEIEILPSLNDQNKLMVINILPLDDYLKGVVPNELPPSYGFEALKAQAVAARCYAIRPREKIYPQFDICDSQACQVYFGQNTEHPLANAAIKETSGLVALYDGDVILALYSSAPGGASEDYANAFSDPMTKVFPGPSLPYLIGKQDIPAYKNLSEESVARTFYTNRPLSFDVQSGYYRWTNNYNATELTSILQKNLSDLSSSSQYNQFISPSFRKGDLLGTLKNIRVLKRGVSGKAMEVAIETSRGRWVVKKELTIRKVFTNGGKYLPSANLILTNLTNTQGDLISLQMSGGGFGHGVGMSQTGAGYLSKRGYKFDHILQHYYTNVSIGTIPVFLSGYGEAQRVKSTFISPYGNGTLGIESSGPVSSLQIIVNGKKLGLGKIDSIERYDISSYLNTGNNEIIYTAPQEQGVSVKLWVDVIKAKKRTLEQKTV